MMDLRDFFIKRDHLIKQVEIIDDHRQNTSLILNSVIIHSLSRAFSWRVDKKLPDRLVFNAGHRGWHHSFFTNFALN